MALDLLSLDAAFEGLPYCDCGPAANTTLDYAFEGLPFAPEGSAATSSGTSAAATTRQAQQASASAAVLSNAVGVIATSQAQQTSASAAVLSNGVGVIATSQAQQAGAVATAGVAATAATSQAQRALALGPVDSTAGTGQAQASSAAVGLGTNASASGAQAQSAQAQASAHTPWQLVGTVRGDNRSSDPTIPAFVLAAGNHVVVSVYCAAYTNRADGSVDASTDRAWTLAVSDSAGNTYVALPPVRDQVLTQGNYPVRWLHQFYCVNALGKASTTVTVTPVSGPPNAYSSATPTLISTVTVLSSSGVAAEFDTAGTAASTDDINTYYSLSLPPATVQPGAAVLYGAPSNGSTSETASSGWTLANNYINAWFTWWRPNNQAGTQTATVSGDSGIRVLAGVSLRAATGILGSTRQAQSSGAIADVITNVVTGSAATAQVQHGAALAATAAGVAVSTAQAQRSTAGSASALVLSASTAQGQSSSAQADAFQPASVATSQGQSSSAQAGVASSASAAAAQVQHTEGQAGTATDASVAQSQAQAASGALASGADLVASTAGAQQATGQLDAAYVAGVATAQDQRSDALAGVAADVQGASEQAQAGSAVAGVAVDSSVTAAQAQGVSGNARGESENTTETGQRQGATGQLGLGSNAPATTRQAQHAALFAGVASDMAVSTGQSQHIGDGNRLVAGVDAIGTTAQARQHVRGVLAHFQPQPGTLGPGTMRLHPSLAGSVQAQPALEAPNRVRTALGGRVDLRPDR